MNGGGDRRGFGSPNPDALYRIRDRFERHEPPVERTELDSVAAPTTLSVRLSDGLQTPGRFEIRWSDRGYYGVHYREPDAGVECRFDRHPKHGTPEGHFHPPPDAPSDTVPPSCIEEGLPDLVALAVLAALCHAHERGDLSAIESVESPP